MSADDIASISITATAATPTRDNFGTPLVAAYHAHYLDRARSYAALAAMVADGFGPWSPAYRIAAACFAQQPRPTRVKVGRRAHAFSQVVDLTPAAPVNGRVYGGTFNGHAASYAATGGDDLAAVCTAVAAALNGVDDEDVDAIHSGGSTTGVQTITSFSGVIGGAAMGPPRALEFVFSAHADWDATTATVTGVDMGGNAISSSFAIPNNGGQTVVDTRLFARVTQVSIPAQSGTGGTYTLGVRRRFTADGSSGTKVTVTTLSAGMLTTFDDLTTDTLTLADQTADAGGSSGIADDLAAILVADSDWYGLLLDSNSKAEARAAAAWVESNGRFFGAQSADAACKDSGSTTDVAYLLRQSAYARTRLDFHPALGTQFLAAGLMGQRFTADPGSDTWAFKTVAGVATYALTDTELANLHAKNAGTYTVVKGLSLTLDGKMADGEYADVVRFLDWLRSGMQDRVLFLLANNPRIQYTDAGVDLVKAEILAQLNEGIRNGGLAATPKPTVTAPLVADVDPTDRANRFLPDVSFTARLAGAIHSVSVNGVVSV